MTRPETRGAVAGGHPATAHAGAEVFRAGGNAADAAVAAVAAAMTAEASLTGMGGGGFAMVMTPEGAAELLDFFVTAPGLGRTDEDREARSRLHPYEVPFRAATQVFNVGPASCAVPGMVPGLSALHEHYGRLPLDRVLDPAIRLARQGARLVHQQDYLHDILEGILTREAGMRALFAPAGCLLRAGDLLRFPDLAEALETWAADGAESFRTGRCAQRLAGYMQANGGLITLDDLAAYRVISREPVRTGYHGHVVLTNPLPSSGGTLIAFTLGLLDRVDLAALDPVDRAETLVTAFEATESAREAAFNDRLGEVDLAREFLHPDHIGRYAPGLASAHSPGNTTHVSAVDTDGLAVAVTSSCGSGSGVLVEGTGFIMNNMMGEEDLNPLGFFRTPLGGRLTSMMAPTLTCGEACQKGRMLALGSAGSARLRSAIVQTLVNMLDLGRSAQEAVDEPRMHWDGTMVHLEGGVAPEVEARLRSSDRRVQAWSVGDLFFGGVQVVSREAPAEAPGRSGMTTASGVAGYPSVPKSSMLVFDGAGDPRRGGTAVIV